MEKWKAIPDYPGYEVSDQGNVRSYWKQQGHNPRILTNCPQKIIRQNKDGHGYYQVNLLRDNIRKSQPVHRMVLEAFVGPCPPCHQTRHLDGDCSNNHLSNLCWGTFEEQQADKTRHGRHQKIKNARGEKQWKAKLTEENIRQIREMALQGHTRVEIGEVFSVTPPQISGIIHRRYWAHVL